MRLADLARLAFGSLLAHRLRTGLSMLGIAIGVTAVILLTSIGEGVHAFVVSEFSQFGTNLIAITPGRVRAHGGSVGVFGSTRPLTLEDADALRHVRYVATVNPAVNGNAEVKAAGRSRRTTVSGVGPDFRETLRMQLATGQFLPHDDASSARAFAVLGAKLRRELYGSTDPLGSRIQVGRDRFRVIGVMAPKGEVLGFDMDDIVYIPAGRAMELFNRDGLMEIDVVYQTQAPLDEVVAGLRRVLLARHGDEDFTITPQQQMLATLNSVLSVLTFAVAALGGISLVVGGIGILTIMIIAVSERTGEIGLLLALGARQRQILALFLGEAVLLAAAGGVAGWVAGAAIARTLHALLPALPVQTPWSYALWAELVAVAIGVLAGVAPARRAARLDPVTALRAE